MTKVVIKAADGVGAVDLYHNANLKIETTADGVKILDNVKYVAGTGNDLEIYHDASNTHFINNTGWLMIKNDDANTSEAIYIRPKGDENSVILRPNGAVELYWDGSKKLETTADGIEVTGKIFSSSHIDLADNVKLLLGTGDDLEIYHNGSTSLIEDSIGDFRLRSDALKLQAAGGANYVHCTSGGAVLIHYDNVKKFETNSEGVEITGKMTFDSSVSGRTIRLDDDQKLFIGTGHDLKLWHDGAHSYIQDEGTGALRIRSDSEVAIQSYVSSTNKNMAKFIPDGAVELYHNDTKKLETTSSGINIGGNLAANPFDYLRFGASQYGAADIRPVNESSHKVGLAFYVDGTADTTINPTEKVRIQAAGGISFNGDTAAANALDDYEEGEWTYTYGSNFSGSASITKGWYVKIGAQVTCYFHIVCTAESGSDQIQVSIPFTSADNNTNSSRRGVGTCMMHSANVPGSDDAYQISSYVPANDTKCVWYISRDNHGWESLTNSHMTANTTSWHAQVTYTAA